MKPSLIVPVIRQRCPSFANRVKGVGDIDAAYEDEKGVEITLPAAFVVPLEDEATDLAVTRHTKQVLVETLCVIVVVAVGEDDASGQDAEEAFQDLRDELLAALVDYNPDESLWVPFWYEPKAVEARVLKKTRAQAWYAVPFRTWRQLP